MCDVINDASKKLEKLIGHPVKLRVIHPEIIGFDYVEPLPKRIYEDFLLKSIIDLVCSDFDITIDQIRSRNRKQHLSDARKLIAYLMIQKSPSMSDTIIGEAINRDRTTALHCHRAAADLIFKNKAFIDRYTRIEAKLQQIINHNKFD